MLKFISHICVEVSLEGNMHKINVYNELKKTIIKTSYGLLTIDNIDIAPDKLEAYCSEILLQKDNLRFIFDKDINCDEDFIAMLELFLPVDIAEDIKVYIEDAINKNVNFYSFFAEALLAVALKDIYNYKLVSAAVDINDTLVDSHTGADACLYDDENNILILGEAKFYKNFSEGLNKIIEDLTSKKGFLNKISSFYKHCKHNPQSKSIIIKQLGKTNLMIIPLDEFLSTDIIYAGFALHEHTGKVDKYLNENFYDNFDVSAEKISKNITDTFGKEIDTKHRIVLFHLPINSKKDLIDKVIETAEKIRMDILHENNQ